MIYSLYMIFHAYVSCFIHIKLEPHILLGIGEIFLDKAIVSMIFRDMLFSVLSLVNSY